MADRGYSRSALAALLVCLGCTTIGPELDPLRVLIPPPPEKTERLQHTPLDRGNVRVQPEGHTIEQNWILDIYTLLHFKRYSVQRLVFPSAQGGRHIAHLLLPDGDGPHPTVVVFPILEGSHVVSEALAKALVRRGYAVARLERHELDLATTDRAEAPAENFRAAILDARRLLDWLEVQPRLDSGRLASAGVSTGGILAATLMGVDPRIRAGFFTMAGGNLPEILYDSSEGPVEIFRKRVSQREELHTREDFVELLRRHTADVDPITYAQGIDSQSVLLISARFDRVLRPRYTRELWEALGRPRWIQVPSGHYQMFPFFWYAAARGADHLDRVFGRK